MTAVDRHLVACPACGLQYDATGTDPGRSFHCGCGEAVTVPKPRPHEAAVVRCSSCGAPRQDQADRCSFCASGFTLHERDLHTICPGCAARISDRARYCHSCGTSISPHAIAGSPTQHLCPACTDGQSLSSRRLGTRDLAILECQRCAGIWVGHEVFSELASEAERVREAVAALGAGHQTEDPTVVEPIQDQERLYRPCAICSSLMHRRNYGRKSGVIVDTCQRHGVWFDHGELDGILRWLKNGGAARARAELQLEERSLERQRELYPAESEGQDWRRPRSSLRSLIGDVVDFLGHFT